MINVLEHVENAFEILQKLFIALKPGGLLIFADRYWDHYNFYGQKVIGIEEPLSGPSYDWRKLDRAYHPIRMKEVIFIHFFSKFEIMMDRRDAPHDLARGETSSYFIGKKKVFKLVKD